MARTGYDPTGTGKYGVGTFYNGVSGVNVLEDGKISYGNATETPSAKPETPIGNSESSSSSATSSVTASKVDVKVATPDVVKAVHDKAYSNEKIMQPLFEDMGLQEILSVTRNSAMNVVNGQNVLYQPIENIAGLALKYNSFNILPLQSADTIFKNFSISLEDKLVADGEGTGPNGESEYIDEANNLVINVTNLQPDELVEIESLNIESLFNDTIYGGATS